MHVRVIEQIPGGQEHVLFDAALDAVPKVDDLICLNEAEEPWRVREVIWMLNPEKLPGAIVFVRDT